MIIFLNGPFSVGKTSVARVLVEQVPGALLYDPELVGSFLRYHILAGIEQPDDFQDIPFWLTLTLDLAGMLVSTYRQPLVIPMSLWRLDRAEQMRLGLAAIDPEVVWLQLTASRKTLTERILARDDVPDGDRSWWFDHLESGLAMAFDSGFGMPVPTDCRSPEEVAESILELAEVAKTARCDSRRY